MSTIKSNIIEEISKTFQCLTWDTAEVKSKITNSNGMVQEAFEKDMNTAYLENNDVPRILGNVRESVAKLEMLLGLLKE